MDASIIICTYNRCESLAITLESLRVMRVDPATRWEVVVVDNNSADGTRRVVEAAAANFPCSLRYVVEAQQGKSHALNTGVAAARGDYLVFTDDDVEVHPEWLQQVVNAFRGNDCMGVGGRIQAVWPGEMPRWFTARGPFRLIGAIIEYDISEEQCWSDVPPLGANVAFRKQAFQRYGLYNTKLGPTGAELLRGEDTEFARRIIDGEDRILYVPGAVVYHPVEPYRLRKGYFRRWYYHYGRTLARRDVPLGAGVTYFGVPRHLFRTLIENAARSLLTMDAGRRFYYQLQCHQVVGIMSEYRGQGRPALALKPK